MPGGGTREVRFSQMIEPPVEKAGNWTNAVVSAENRRKGASERTNESLIYPD